MLKLGIDDAGRGPVIGPMVLSGVLIDKELEKELREQGVKDSKLIKPEIREKLAKMIKKKAMTYKVFVASAKEIDKSINGGVNLNRIEAIKSAQIINKVNETVKDKIKVVVDCPSRNLERWGRILQGYIDNMDNLEIVVEHEADKNHIAVGAASIIAKTTRDKEVSKIQDGIDEEIGSGYPSDPITKKFLKKHVKKYKEKGIFRETWVTWQIAKEKKEQSSLNDY